MSDYDRRHNGYRGGGRKRRFRDEDDYDRRQRRRYEEPLSARLRRQLIGIAESVGLLFFVSPARKSFFLTRDIRQRAGSRMTRFTLPKRLPTTTTMKKFASSFWKSW